MVDFSIDKNSCKVQLYVSALSLLDYPRRKTVSHTSQGVQYKCKQATSKFYDKQQECKNPLAFGKLRQEITLRCAAAIERVTGKKRATLRDITPKMIEKNLNKDLERLQILNKPFLCKDAARSVLSSQYGNYAGPYILGCLKDNEYKTKEQIAKEIGVSKKTLDRRIENAVKANVAPALTVDDEYLDGLSVDLSEAVGYCREGLTNSIDTSVDVDYYQSKLLRN